MAPSPRPRRSEAETEAEALSVGDLSTALGEDFEVLQRLGHRAMASVFLAKDAR